MNQIRATRIVFFAAGVGISAWAPLIPLVKNNLNIEADTLGLLLFFLGLGSIISMPVTGLLSARFGCRRVITLSGICTIIMLPFLVMVSNPTQLGLALFLFGASIGTVDVSMNIQAVVVEKNAKRSLMSGFHGFFSLGGIFGASGVSALLYFNYAAIATCLIVSLMLIVLFSLAYSGLIHETNLNYKADKKIAFPRGIVIVACLLCLMMGIIEGSVIDWSAIFLSGERGISTSLSGLGYAAFAATMTIGRFMGDRLISRIGGRKVFFIGTATIAIGFFLIVSWDEFAISMVGFALIGLGASNIVPILCSISGSQKIMPPSHAVAAIVTFGYSGIMAGPALIGFVAQYTSLETAFTALAVGALIMMANMTVVKDLPK
ncbi:MFS transporter [Photorhabdus stackebrandtii]|nr:MFS transporter [Photorhabdus stackebrandtii]